MTIACSIILLATTFAVISFNARILVVRPARRLWHMNETSHDRVQQLRVACRKRDKGRHPAVSGNDEISPGVSWRLTGAARYPLDPPAIAQFLGLSNWLISKVRVSRLDRARDAIDLVVATVEAPGGVVEHAIFGEDLLDGRTPTRGVVFTEDLLKIAGQQGRYAVGHDRLVLVGEVIVERNV
jgi:hypothetical protein